LVADNVYSGDGADDDVDGGDVDGGDDFSTFQARTHAGVFSPVFLMVSNLTWYDLGNTFTIVPALRMCLPPTTVTQSPLAIFFEGRNMFLPFLW
jgi:hypothetical protein